jgi:hypothetical protein
VQPTLWINPHGDHVFVEVVESIARQEGATVEALERALRARYPNAQVHARNLSGEQDVTWYVYREGRWVSTGQ